MGRSWAGRGGMGRQRTWSLVHVASHLAFFCWYSAPRSYRSAVTCGPSIWLHRMVSTWTTSHEAEPSSSWRASGVGLGLGHGLGRGLGLGLRLRLAVRVQAEAEAEAEAGAGADAPVCPE